MNTFNKLITLLVFSSLYSFARWLPPEVDNVDRSKMLNSIQSTMTESGITQAEFEELISGIQKVYTPIVTKNRGFLRIAGSWSNDRLVAQAFQQMGAWNIEISGGMARLPTITKDGITLIVCHELGHHLAGFSYSNGFLFFPPWAANEGQADYFATQVCAKKLWSNDLEINAQFRNQVPETGKKQCDDVYSTENEQNICYRSVMAGISLGETLAFLTKKQNPSLDTPDLTQVQKTFIMHPNPQCRLDTYFQGALCNAVHDDNVIPGKSKFWRNSRGAEKAASLYSCTKSGNYSYGLRPNCWFKARL